MIRVIYRNTDKKLVSTVTNKIIVFGQDGEVVINTLEGNYLVIPSSDILTIDDTNIE